MQLFGIHYIGNAMDSLYGLGCEILNNKQNMENLSNI